MREFKTIFRNISYLLASEIISKLVNFFQVIYLVRYLGKTAYGIWSLVLSLPALFSMLLDFGLNSILLRRIARDKAIQDRIFQQVMFLKVLLSLIFNGVIFIFLNITRYEPHIKMLTYVMSVDFTVVAFWRLIVSVNRANENFAFESIYKIVKSVLFFVLAISMISFNLGVTGLVWSYLFIDIAILLYSALRFGRKNSIRLKIYRIPIYIELLRKAFPFALFALVGPIFMQIDIVMLSQLSTYEFVGIYNAPYRIILFLYYIPVALKNALFPRLSRIHLTSPEEYRNILGKAIKIVLLISLPATVILFLAADRLIPLLFSEEYLNSIMPLKLLSLTIVFYFVRTVLSSSLYASNREYVALIILGCALIINLVLDFAFIPRFNAIGAAMATLTAEVLLAISYYIVVKNRISSFYCIKITLRILIAAGIMSGAMILFKTQSVFLQIGIGVLVYMISSILSGAVTRENIRSITKFASRM